MSLLQKIKNQQEKNKNVHLKFINGEYGLTKTFWLYWFAPVVLITIIEAITAKNSSGIQANIFIIVWSIITLIAVFNPPIKDKKLWKNVALIFIGLTIITRIFNMFI